MDTRSFFEYLERRAASDTSVIATLRRAQAYDPGSYAAAFPIVEPFTRGLSERDRRTVYLVAGQWANAQRRGTGAAMSMPVALHRVQKSTASASVEARFVSLLDADADELVWRLRHVVSLVSSEGLAIDWPDLLQDLLRWGAPNRFVQQAWARRFWQEPTGGPSEPASVTSESAQ